MNIRFATHRVCGLLALALACTGWAVGQGSAAKQPAKAPGQPAASDVIARYVKALGGRANYMKLTTRVSKGTLEFVGQGGAGTLEAYQKAPNRILVLTNIEGYGTVSEGYDGRVGWMQEPGEAPKELTGVELAESARDSDFYEEINLDKKYTSVKVTDIVKVDEADAYLLEGTLPDGDVERLYFSVASGLLVRKDTTAASGAGKEWVEVYYADYRPVDGVQLPFTMRQVSGGVALVVRITEVRHNVPIEDAKFAKPPGD